MLQPKRLSMNRSRRRSGNILRNFCDLKNLRLACDSVAVKGLPAKGFGGRHHFWRQRPNALDVLRNIKRTARNAAGNNETVYISAPGCSITSSLCS